MPDSWELDFFGSLEQIHSDWDEDGCSNVGEYIAGTDPTNAASLFCIENMNAPMLFWTAKSGRTYSVYWTDNLSRPFICIADGLSTGSYADNLHSGNTANYYRVQVELE